ncbi:MAG: DNA polymerase III subunit gamma/tau [Chloroflexi bacterium]|nr:DNA polymerase III subunit gamma/tau [Chloroflexota bacterium]
MSSQVFYRKWRPRTFSQVVGQEHVTTTLRHAVSSGRTAHAYLFSGPRGTGKTSTGRILAKAVNCLSPQDGDPCDRCAMCQAVNEARFLDLVEIDAASNRGIDEARDLREKARFAPYAARRKVYIIDEVHQFTPQAFDALLKTLEEPPPHVMFILATTEPHKVPPTILSRCQRFDFRRIAEADVVQRLAQLCVEEGIELEPAGLKLVARAAGGSLRDAENLLEQLVVGYGTRLSSQQVAEVMGATTDQRSHEVARLLLRRELSQALALLNQAHEEGVDLRQFHRGLVEYLRGVMLVQAGAEVAVAQEASVLADMKVLAQATTAELVVKAVKTLAGVVVSPEEPSPLPLELALAEVSLIEPVEPAPEVRATVGPGSTPVAAPAQPRAAAPTPVAAPPQPPRAPAEPPAPAPPPAAAPIAPAPLAGDLAEWLRRNWKEITQRDGALAEATRGKGGGAVDALLRSACEPLRVENDTLVLGFQWPANLDKMEKALNDPPTRKALEGAFAQIVGRPLKVSCILVPKDKKPVSAAAPPAPPPPSKAGGHMLKEAIAQGARPVENEEI